MKSRIKIAIIAASLAAVTAIGIFAVPSTLAFLSNSDTAVNQIQSIGDVSISLQETEWDKLTDSDNDGYKDKAKNQYPCEVTAKNPTITNTGNTDAYVYITIEMPVRNVRTVLTSEAISNVGPTEMFEYETDKDWNYLSSGNSDSGSDINKYIYVYSKVLKPNETTTPLFTEVKLANVLEGEIKSDDVLNLKVKASAIQTDTGTTDSKEILEKLEN